MSLENLTTTQPDKSFEFRCPQCLKLYTAKSSQIYSSEPQFECAKCHCLFSFAYPPADKTISTKALAAPQVLKLSRKEKGNSPELQTCPQCQAVSPRTAIDCYKCGVVFAKAQASLKALPSLVKMWQELLQDYNNMRKHVEFVDRCEDLQALPFALKKYQLLRETQPHDSLTQEMFSSVIIKSLAKNAKKYKKIPMIQSFLQLPWANIFRVSPLVFGGSILVVGVLREDARNLAGAGVAFLAFTLGLAYFIHGRLRWADFWQE
jgi:hypothetical protein